MWIIGDSRVYRWNSDIISPIIGGISDAHSFYLFPVIKEEPEDLTHLAPEAGDACIPLAYPPGKQQWWTFLLYLKICWPTMCERGTWECLIMVSLLLDFSLPYKVRTAQLESYNKWTSYNKRTSFLYFCCCKICFVE